MLSKGLSKFEEGMFAIHFNYAFVVGVKYTAIASFAWIFYLRVSVYLWF